MSAAKTADPVAGVAELLTRRAALVAEVDEIDRRLKPLREAMAPRLAAAGAYDRGATDRIMAWLRVHGPARVTDIAKGALTRQDFVCVAMRRAAAKGTVRRIGRGTYEVTP